MAKRAPGGANKFLALQMETDLVSALLRISEGGVNFFASCLLYLDPNELKVCRLVNRAWDKFIRKEVWGSKVKRLLLKERLLQRWKNVDPAAEEFGPVRMMVDPDQVNKGVDSIFCNNSHVFCGLPCGKVSVYSLTTGNWVRDLVPGGVDEDEDNETKMKGSDLVVAAFILEDTKVTVWSSTKEMEQLFSLDVNNYPCSDVSCEHSGDEQVVDEIEVVGDKVVLLRWAVPNITSLIVIMRSDQNEWESKILACIKGNNFTHLAAEEDWIAVAVGRRPNPTVKLWQSNNFRQDISLPECHAFNFAKIALKKPFMVICCGGLMTPSRVQVYQLASDNLMGDIRPVASLIKTRVR